MTVNNKSTTSAGNYKLTTRCDGTSNKIFLSGAWISKRVPKRTIPIDLILRRL